MKNSVLEAILSQPSDALVLAKRKRDQLIVSAVKIEDEWHVASRFGDPVWKLVRATTNTRPGGRDIDFVVAPVGFREDLKAMLYHYHRSGRRGRSRPSDAWLRKVFITSQPFLRHLSGLGVNSFGDVTPDVCISYVAECKKTNARRRKKPLAQGTLELRFLMVEILYDLSQILTKPMRQYPWPDSTARVLAGRVGRDAPYLQVAKTKVIPDEIFAKLFQVAELEIGRAPEILRIRKKLEAVEVRYKNSSASTVAYQKTKLLSKCGWEAGLPEFNSTVHDIRTACYIVIASLSGCRAHELGNMKMGCYYSTFGEDGERYWWMKSRSTKTNEGRCEWLVPERAVDAIKVMESWADPYRKRIRDEIANRRRQDSGDIEIAEAMRHVDALFVGAQPGGVVRTLTPVSWNAVLTEFARKNAIPWRLSTHQFRRTFAVYAARSKFGDLRYLRQHFKHWSMDMSLLYAANEWQELDLLTEVASELDEMQQGLVAKWLEPSAKLAGGAGKSIQRFRDQNPVPIYKSRAAMAKTLSDQVYIRSTGHAWCTADNASACIGNGLLEQTRCSNCSHGVVDASHAGFYRRLFDDLSALLSLPDIGQAGRLRVTRDLDRCSSVLRDLGIDVKSGIDEHEQTALKRRRKAEATQARPS